MQEGGWRGARRDRARCRTGEGGVQEGKSEVQEKKREKTAEGDGMQSEGFPYHERGN